MQDEKDNQNLDTIQPEILGWDGIFSDRSMDDRIPRNIRRVGLLFGKERVEMEGAEGSIVE